MANNEFLVNRVVSASFPVPANTASSWGSGGVFVPSGAIVTGVTFIQTTTPVVANAANTICLYVGTGIPLMAVTAISDFSAASTIPYAGALLTTAGMYIGTSGELLLKNGVSNGTNAWTYRPDVYVGYLKA
jgi:hypothetical protein